MSPLIALDFDGTLAYWPAGAPRCYDDPWLALCRSAALPGPVRWVQGLQRQGHDIHIVTGRSEAHAQYLRYWSRLFFGAQASIWCRPPDVSITPRQQATWKALVLEQLSPMLFVGDNRAIDEAAAHRSATPYLDARILRAGIQPALTPGQASPPMLDWPEGDICAMNLDTHPEDRQ